MHPSCREHSGGGRLSWPFPPPAQLEAEHPAVMEISSTGQRGKLTDCLRSVLLIYARINLLRVLWFCRRGPLDVTGVVSSVSHLIDDSRALSFISELSQLADAKLFGSKMSDNKHSHDTVTVHSK